MKVTEKNNIKLRKQYKEYADAIRAKGIRGEHPDPFPIWAAEQNEEKADT